MNFSFDHEFLSLYHSAVYDVVIISFFSIYFDLSSHLGEFETKYKNKEEDPKLNISTCDFSDYEKVPI